MQGRAVVRATLSRSHRAFASSVDSLRFHGFGTPTDVLTYVTTSLLARGSCCCCAAARAHARTHCGNVPPLLPPPPHHHPLPPHHHPSSCSVEQADIGSGAVRVKMLASPVSTADLTAIEGFNGKTAFPAVGGNVGVGVVEAVPAGAKSLHVGDWVVAGRPGLGTWRKELTATEDALIKVASDIPVEQAATLGGSPSVALRLLSDFAQLGPGDVVIQNAANSAVGEAVVQICAARGIQTVSIVSDGAKTDDTVRHLQSLGGTLVIPERMAFSKIASLLADLPAPKLAINGAGGESASAVASVVAPGGIMVTYGSEHRSGVTVPTSALVAGDLRLAGFSLARWASSATAGEAGAMISELTGMVKEGKLRSFCELKSFADWNSAVAAAGGAYDREVVITME